jgi:hypothetical protein
MKQIKITWEYHPDDESYELVEIGNNFRTKIVDFEEFMSYLLPDQRVKFDQGYEILVIDEILLDDNDQGT